MPPFNPGDFAVKVKKDLEALKDDVRILKNLSGEQRKAVLKKIFNAMIDIPGAPEFLEAMLFGLLVEGGAYFLEAKLGPKEKRCSNCGASMK